MAFKRLPNGFGSVTKMSGNRRRPYRARKFVRYEVDDVKHTVKAVYATIGYYASKKEAIDALAAFQPEQLEKKTFKTVYHELMESKKDLSASTVNIYKCAYAHFRPLQDSVFRELKTADYERVINENVARSMRIQARGLLSLMYDFALRHEYCVKNYSKLVDFKIDRTTRIVRIPFTASEVDALFRDGSLLAEIAIVGCYTGFRPSELLALDAASVHLRDGYIVGGMKTEAGKDRIVPIHPAIRDLMVKRVGFAADGKLWPVSYHQLQHWMKAHGHSSHDTRHTFATFAKISGMDPAITKRILGHVLTDVTERIYTHVGLNELKIEMSKYKIGALDVTDMRQNKAKIG